MSQEQKRGLGAAPRVLLWVGVGALMGVLIAAGIVMVNKVGDLTSLTALGGKIGAVSGVAIGLFSLGVRDREKRIFGAIMLAAIIGTGFGLAEGMAFADALLLFPCGVIGAFLSGTIVEGICALRTGEWTT